MLNPNRSTPQERLQFAKQYYQGRPGLTWLTSAILRMRARHTEYGKNPDNFIGMLTGSIIAKSLFHPVPGATPVYECASKDCWLGYDFTRPGIVPAQRNGSHRQLFHGVLESYLLDEVKDNPVDQPTPTTLLNLTDINHVLCADMSGSMEPLEASELVISTTYADAYKRVGTYDKFAHDLVARGLTDSIIHQVTPKGNGLIFLKS